MARSLQFRVTVGFVAVIALTVALLGFVMSSVFSQALNNQYLATYENNAVSIQSIIQNSLQGNLFTALWQEGQLPRVVNPLSKQFSVRVQIYLAADGVQIADSGTQHADPARHLAVDHFPAFRLPITAGYPETIAYVVVSAPLTDRVYVESQLVQNTIWIAVAACMLAFVVGGILSDRLTEPLRVLTRAVVRIGGGNLHERVPVSGRDEAGELARQFNTMAARLEESFNTISADRDSLRQFVADVSHELRTPLTALRTFNDLLQDGAGADPATRQDFLGESARQIERLDWLTHNLLDLSRLDAGIAQLKLVPHDLGETVRRAVEAQSTAAAAKGVSFDLQIAALTVAHDPPWLEQALGNVIGNAVKFSPPDGVVSVRLYEAGGEAMIEVSDDGPGIPADEAPHVFERFYRGQAANRSGKGSGLGLAIARAIVSAHNGTISVVSHSGPGTTIRFSFSLAPAHT